MMSDVVFTFDPPPVYLWKSNRITIWVILYTFTLCHSFLYYMNCSTYFVHYMIQSIYFVHHMLCIIYLFFSSLFSVMSLSPHIITHCCIYIFLFAAFVSSCAFILCTLHNHYHAKFCHAFYHYFIYLHFPLANPNSYLTHCISSIISIYLCCLYKCSSPPI